MASEGFKFGCPYCSQHIRAYDEYIGEVITCPTCNAEIVVPNPHILKKAAYVVNEQESSNYMPAELQALRGADEALKERILKIPKENSWEMAVLAEMLDHRLQALKQVIEGNTGTFRFDDTVEYDPEALFRDIDDRFNRFINILYTTYDILLYTLPQAMYQESLVMIVDFANQIGEQINLIVKYHNALYKYTLPSDYPYTHIQGVQSSWAPHILETLMMSVDTLRAASEYSREEAAHLSNQYSIIPASIHYFLVLRQYLVVRLQDGGDAETTDSTDA